MLPDIYSFQTYKYVRAIMVFKFLLWVEEGYRGSGGLSTFF